MAHQILKDCKLLVGGFDLSGDTNQLGLTYEAEMQDDTTFGDDTRVLLPGLRTVSAEHAGMVNVDNADGYLFDQVGGSADAMTIAPTDGTDGEVAFSVRNVTANYSPGAAIGELYAFTLTAQATGELVRGTVMLDLSAARTASGTGTARQLGAVDAGEALYAALHVVAASGTSPTLDVVVESDDDVGMASPVTRITFAQATDVGGQWQSAAGAVADDFFRVSYTIGGTDPSFTFLVNVGIK